ncbi:MAG: PKD domain-containing protein, partial [Phaeodactylibacter sp.]|nr:PKD domain-containing protein [Phaeodactylibacter sp.]
MNTLCEQFTVGCSAPDPGFSIQEDGLQISLTDVSSNNPTSWFWTFGDGSMATSQNPEHTYNQPGTYTVCLEASSICGSETHCEQVQVTCSAPQASFTIQQNDLDVAFFDASTLNPTSWSWNFGDGNVSDIANPLHSFDMPGTYTVCLTVSSVCGTTDICQNITVNCPAPQADFEFTPNQLAMIFNDISANAPTSWSWDFGDGNFSNEQSPTHTFAGPGIFTICLTSSSVCGTSEICKTVSVTCNAPQSNFSFMGTDLEVDFSDISSNFPNGWFWTFGDGNGSTLQNPSHTYAGPGNYLVCLQASSVCGSTQRCELITVTCTPPQANFGFTADELEVSFLDSTTLDPIAWLWTFGDGQSSTLNEPNHTYQNPGAYEVCLTTSNICGNTQFCDSVTVICSPPWVNFNWIESDGSVSFFQLADDSVTDWSWDFGDGNISNEPNPIHTFLQSGNYPVCLTATDLCGTNTFCDTLEIMIVGVEETTIANIKLFPNPAMEQVQLFAPGISSGQVSLLTMQGQMIGRWEFEGGKSIIPLVNYPSGTYVLQLESETIYWRERLFIVK